jgi:hypothetical protein
MTTIDATPLFDVSKPFNPKMVSRKFITFTAAAKRTNRLMLQQNYDVEEECSICLMSMLDKSVIYTPCKHRFHYKCMFAMMGGPHQSRHKCPLCRFDLTSAAMKLNDDDIRLVLLFSFITVPVSLAVGANEVGANEVVPNEVVPNEVVPNEPVAVDEVISLFDSISEEEYDDEDEEYDEEDDEDEEDDNEAELGDAWGVFL